MQNLINPSDQNRLVQLLMAQESSTGGNVIKSGLGVALNKLNLQDVIQVEIACALQSPPAFVDLSSEITIEKAAELATLSLSIRQL